MKDTVAPITEEDICEETELDDFFVNLKTVYFSLLSDGCC